MTFARISRAIVIALTALGGLLFASVLVYAVLTAFKATGEPFGGNASWIPAVFNWTNIAKPFQIAPFGRK